MGGDLSAAGAVAVARPPVVVEFAGLPGAGKSAVAADLVAELAVRGYRCSGRIVIGAGGPASRLLGAARALAADPVLVARALRLAASLRPRHQGRLRQVLKLPSWRRRWEMARHRALDVMVLEEGLVQNLWGVLLGGARVPSSAADPVLRAAYAGSRASFAFVFFDVDVETALARIAIRGNPSKRVDRAPAAEQRRLLSTNGPQLGELVERAARLTGAPLLRVDARRPPGESLEEVLRFVELLPGLRRPEEGSGRAAGVHASSGAGG